MTSIDPPTTGEAIGVSGGSFTHFNQYPRAVIEWAQDRIRAEGHQYDSAHNVSSVACQYLELRSDCERTRISAKHWAELRGLGSLIFLAAKDERDGVAIPEHKPLW